jgi:AcrR family transcriptional regulator
MAAGHDVVARQASADTARERVLSPRGQRTRAMLVAAASEIFSTTPFDKVRLSDITGRARVAAGTFYTYFDSKEMIFREVAADVLAEMSNAARASPDDERDEDPVRAIANATRRYFLCCLRHAMVARSIEQLTLRDPAIGRSRESTVVTGVKRYERWIRRLQISGICDREIDSWDTAMVLHTMTVRVAYDHLLMNGDPDDVERLVEAVTHVSARTVGLERTGGGVDRHSPDVASADP